jgi:glycosyltransferase involved in cell wall biosynthesis/SAM-dependent methyltransferase
MQAGHIQAVPILIPAYQPGEALHTVVHDLLVLGDNPLIVVDDGSGPECAVTFQRLAANPRVHLVYHAVNLGKGAALKTGLNYALVNFPNAPGVVTADADGQHHPEDILRVSAKLAANPGALTMGVRAFAGEMPLRSRIGNNLTRVLMHLLIGHRLADTQTGLRGVPAGLIPHLLRLQSSGYEFELDMLIACKHHAYPVLQEPIRTIYLDGNKSSHFRPIFDSMRIYLLLLRFSVFSLLTAVLDNAVFVLAFGATGSIGQSQIAARSIAMVFNYVGARALVFHSSQRHAIVLPKYVSLVIVNGCLSYALIQLMHGKFGLATMSSKLLAEGLLFIANFAIQRDFIFTRRKATGTATDWDSYYTSVPTTAKLTRRYTTGVLLDSIKRYAAALAPQSRLSILEIGGANSCFLDSIVAEVACERYDVVDTNHYGLSLLGKHVHDSGIVYLHEKSVLGLSLDRKADLVFSVGLIEHFERRQTREAVRAHFDVLRPGGIAIITFPTPTLLYRLTRRFIEILGMWKFPDERPLEPPEVVAAVRDRADVLYQKTLWPLMLTQHLIVARKRNS